MSSKQSNKIIWSSLSSNISWTRIFLSQSKKYAQFPNLLSTQIDGFDQFIHKYLDQLFKELCPIYDIAWEKLSLDIIDIQVGEPLDDLDICKKKELTYGGIISARLKLTDHENKKKLFDKRVNIWILPLMTQRWSYVVSGVERVIISQIIRSYGIFFSYDRKLDSHSFKIIPEKWSWVQVSIEKNWSVVARVNNSRKFHITSLLKVLWFSTDESIKEMFKDSFDEEDFDYISTTFQKDKISTAEDAAVSIYSKIRPGEIIDADSASDYIKSIFLEPDRIYLWDVARRKINAKLWLSKDLDAPNSHLFDSEDMIAALKYLFKLANNARWFYADDIDHLANRRIRSVGELLYAHLNPVMRRFVKSVRWKLSVLNLEDHEPLKLTSLVNFKMIDNSIKSFFSMSQMSQFLDQINPLAEIEHKRRITALGPWWLKRETATFEVRDVHQSHYGRICPIETPEGQNIWLVVYQALYSKINAFGFVETPAVKVFKSVKANVNELEHRILENSIYDSKGTLIAAEDVIIDWQIAIAIAKELWKETDVPVRPFIKDVVEYISPEYDEKYVIADISVPVDSHGNIMTKRVPARSFSKMEMFYVNDITHVDVNPSQIFSPNTSIIPFVDHNDAVRASMGTNMQRQAVPLLLPEAPLVGTWLESDIADMTYAVVKSDIDGEVIYVDAKQIKIKWKEWLKVYDAITFQRSNQKTLIHQRPKVTLWQNIKKWNILFEGPSVVNGEVSLGKNIFVAFMPWEWYNFEDAIVISQRLVKDDDLTSIHIDEYEIEVSDTKLWPEESTNDIPGVWLGKLKDLNDDGIIRIWATVKWWDILIGKITPKSEWELSPEEKLIQAIFGDKSKSYRDSSLYMPAGSEGKVIDVVILDSKKWDNLNAWVRMKIKVYVAMTRKIEVGDKLAGRHGNKWIIAVVVPEEDMPFTADGKSIDICLNPLWVISRMNIGQTMETQLGLVAKAMGSNVAVPLFSDFTITDLQWLLVDHGYSNDGKTVLYDGRNWEQMHAPVTVWYMYVIKLSHMVEDKIHARSVWPYSLITQQPLWWKARQWWQRFGEMEVRALEAYWAVYTLQEMLTIKSDDVVGRNKTYESIIKWKRITSINTPESFNLVTHLFKWLGQNIVPLDEQKIESIHNERVQQIIDLWLKWITNVDRLEDIVWTKAEILWWEEVVDDKEEIVNTVLEELKEHWDIEEN